MRSFTVGKLALVHLFQEDTHTQTESMDQKLHHTFMCIHTYTRCTACFRRPFSAHTESVSQRGSGCTPSSVCSAFCQLCLQWPLHGLMKVFLWDIITKDEIFCCAVWGRRVEQSGVEWRGGCGLLSYFHSVHILTKTTTSLATTLKALLIFEVISIPAARFSLWIPFSRALCLTVAHLALSS